MFGEKTWFNFGNSKRESPKLTTNIAELPKKAFFKTLKHFKSKLSLQTGMLATYQFHLFIVFSNDVIENWLAQPLYVK